MDPVDHDNEDDDDYEARPRQARAVAERALGLIAAIGKVHYPAQNAQWMQQQGIDTYLSSAERAFVGSDAPTEQDRINFSWRAEALASLMWSLNALPELPPFNQTFDAFGHAAVRQAIQHTPAFLREAALRPLETLQAMESFLYHQHWRVRDRDLGFHNDQPGPDDPPIGELTTGIVYERRYGMSWVVGHGEDWDDVPTDT